MHRLPTPLLIASLLALVEPAVAQPRPDSMSIPFFPLHVGDQRWYERDGWDDTRWPPSGFHDQWGGGVDRDTVIEGRPYIVRADIGAAFRTNGVDSVWVYDSGDSDHDTATHEFLYCAFGLFGKGDTIACHEPWNEFPDDLVVTFDSICVGYDPFLTSKPSMQEVFDWRFNVDYLEVRTFDEDWGLARIVTTGLNMTSETKLVGMRRNGVMYGRESAVQERSAPQSPNTRELRPYPNPISRSLSQTLIVPGVDRRAVVELRDILGRRCDVSITNDGVLGTHLVDVSRLPPGAYAVCVIEEQGHTLQRVVVVR